MSKEKYASSKQCRLEKKAFLLGKNGKNVSLVRYIIGNGFKFVKNAFHFLSYGTEIKKNSFLFKKQQRKAFNNKS